MRGADRRGTVLAIVILLVVIIGLLALELMDRSMSSSTRAAWGRDHLTLRLLSSGLFHLDKNEPHGPYHG